MSGRTGIELGPDHCVLVRARGRGSRSVVSAAKRIDLAETGDGEAGFQAAIASARAGGEFSALARVVAWQPSVAALTRAGFEIEDVLSPADALAAVVRTRRGPAYGEAIAAVSLNEHGVVMAIVVNGAAAGARTLEWPLGRPFTGDRPEMLERHLVISQVAPPLRHFIELARRVHGVAVSRIVACGDLPDLRSLSMLLIEELDMEVDTLDGNELFEREPDGALPASALQLAAAAAAGEAIPAPVAPRHPASRIPLSGSVSALATIVTGAWLFGQIAGASPASPLFAAASPASVIAEQSDAVVPTLKTEATIGRVSTAAAEPAPQPPPRLPEVPVSTAARATPSIPLPRVDGVMLSDLRRLAIVDGIIVGAGDRVGTRTLTEIRADGVVFREPSGRTVFVAIRTRKSPGTGIRPQP
jgi:hypothetical protein